MRDMALELTDQQRQSLDAGAAVEITDGRIVYVFTKQQFERFQNLMKIEESDPSLFEFTDEVLFEK